MHSSPVNLGLLGFLAICLSLAWSCAPHDDPESHPDAASGRTNPPSAASSQVATTDEPAAATPDLTKVLHRGIDVSVHSGEVSWSEVAAEGHSYAFVKATEGMDLQDPAFDANWAQMKAAGLVRGAYHFYVTEDDPQDQAQFFIETVQLEAGDLAPVVDIETIGDKTQPGLAARLRRFLDLIESHYGVVPIIYTAPNFWDEHLSDDFGRYPLWIAEYDVESPRLPKGWERWTLWQWSADAQVPGVAHGADLSHLNPVHSGLDHLMLAQ